MTVQACVILNPYSTSIDSVTRNSACWLYYALPSDTGSERLLLEHMAIELMFLFI